MNKKAIIRNGVIVYDTDAATIQPNETAARERRTGMQMKNRKELLQKNQVDFYKAYPEQLENLSPELRRQLS